MLPKPEKKTKTKNPDSQQLDLVEAISSVDKLQKKRRLLLIAIFFTIGLPLLFSIYSKIRHLEFKAPSFSLPKLSSSSDSSPANYSDLDSQINKLLPSSSDFSLYLRLSSDSFDNYSYSHQAQNLFQDQNYQQLVDSLSQRQPDTNSPLASLLPQGVTLYQEQLIDPDQIEIRSLIIIPKRQILIITRSDPHSSSLDLDSHSQLQEQLYWLLLHS